MSRGTLLNELTIEGTTLPFYPTLSASVKRRENGYAPSSTTLVPRGRIESDDHEGGRSIDYLD